MKSVSTFKVVLIAFFLLITVIAVAVFAGFGGAKQATIPTATVWGTVPASIMQEVVRRINEVKTVIDVTYVQKSPEMFHEDFVEALAQGDGPDLIIISDKNLYQEKNKIIPIGFQTFPEREFRETFADVASILVTKEGILGVPLVIDPLVMYWNRDMFSAAAISRPPRYWSELTSLSDKIIQREEDSRIIKALVPFGEYVNVNNAKDILATLSFQIGNPLYYTDPVTGDIQSIIDDRPADSSKSTFEGVIDFYTQFSNPTKNIYSWNRSMSSSQSAFLSGDLALYFGGAGEIATLRDKNPNLNFEVALVPRADGGESKVQGNFYGMYLVKGSRNVTSALSVISFLSSQSSSKIFAESIGLPSARNDLLVDTGESAYKSVFIESAIQSKTWFDPDAELTDSVFLNMIESITTNKAGLSDAISTARLRIDQAYRDRK